MNDQVIIFDTTLRDGEQALGSKPDGKREVTDRLCS